MFAHAEGVVETMTAKIKAMGRFEVSFTLSSGDFRTAGRCIADGREYYFTMGDTEIFCDGATRFEVDKSVREIAVNSVDPADRDMLSSPVAALDFLNDDCLSHTVAQDSASLTVRLMRADSPDKAVDVVIDRATVLPRRFVYRAGGGTVVVELSDMRKFSGALPRYDASAYGGYEIIDYRD